MENTTREQEQQLRSERDRVTRLEADARAVRVADVQQELFTDQSLSYSLHFSLLSLSFYSLLIP